MALRSAQTGFASGYSQTEITSPRARKVRRLGWTVFFIVGFVIFTLIKFPKERISEWLMGMMNEQLRASGFSLTSQSSDISLGFGITLKLNQATLNPLGSTSGISFDEVGFNPAIISTIFGKPAGTLELKSGNGFALLDFDFQTIAAAATIGKVKFEVKSLDLKKTGIFPFLLSSFFPRFPGSESMFQFNGAGILEGEGLVEGNFMASNSLQGMIKLNLKQVYVQEKSLLGFRIPDLNISSLKLDLSLIKGKATIRALDIGGQPGDDLSGKLSGEILLGKEMNGSSTNLKTQFTLSQKVKDSAGILLQNLDELKKPDGSYAALLTGPWGSLVPSPDMNK